MRIDGYIPVDVMENRFRNFYEPVWQVCQLLEARHGDLSAREMAAVIGRSERQSREIFQAIIGESFRSARLRARLAPALKLVRDTMLPISEIAERLGYRSRTKFDQSYKRLFGVAPAADRRAKSKKSSETAAQGLDRCL